MSKTIEQIQSMITSKYDAREVINEIADYLQANQGGGGGTAPYKVYVAILDQAGTAAPTANVLQNTIGNIVWSRASPGDYRATLAGAFGTTKTYVSMTNNFFISNGITPVTVGVDNNGFDIEILDGTGDAKETFQIYIEVRVYP